MNIPNMNPHDAALMNKIDGIASEDKFMTPLSPKLYEQFLELIDKSISTDIVELGPTELGNFARYWRKEPQEAMKGGFTIPGDIILEGTIPIMDMTIVMSVDDNVVANAGTNVRIVLFENAIRRIDEAIKTGADDMIVGAIILKGMVAFPLLVSMDTMALAVMSQTACLAMRRNEYIRALETLTNDTKSLYLTIMGMVAPAWYGMQVALLHPATKDVFANPTRKKRDRKEQLKPVIVNGIPKRVKYVKKHVITPGNGIYATLETSMKAMINSENSDKRKYERHTYIWRVIGHYRNMGEKKVWVKPYWKGPLKDFSKVVKVDANHRDIDLEGGDSDEKKK